MRTKIVVGLMVAAAALAAAPTASATDLVCLNGGADCLSLQGSGSHAQVCLESNTYNVPETCTPEVEWEPTSDAEHGTCIVREGGTRDNYICTYGPDGVLCQYTTEHEEEAFTFCVVAPGWRGHAACIGAHDEPPSYSSYLACVL